MSDAIQEPSSEELPAVEEAEIIQKVEKEIRVQNPPVSAENPSVPADLIERDSTDELVDLCGPFPDINGVKIGNMTFTVKPFHRGDGYIKLSQRQSIFLNELLLTFNPLEAAKKAGVKPPTAVGWLKRPDICQYFNDRKLERALSQGLTVDFLNSIAYETLMGLRELNKGQVKVLELVMKQFGLLGDRPSNPFSNADAFVFMAKKGELRSPQGEPSAR